MSKEIILTGLRTNAEYHLGNYLGAILPIVQMAKNKSVEYQINMFIPDLHSFTTTIDHSKLHNQTTHNINLLVGAGLPINNENIYLYRQSYIPAHSELTVILNNFSYFGELSRMTQFKDKTTENTSAGLFDYPVLMASDILLYGAKWVPVGDDQTQHLEFTRDIAQRFNSKFGEIFTIPEEVSKQHEFLGRNQGPRIRSLKNPDKKMSKSIDDPNGTIQLSDTPQDAKEKIMSSTTDSLGQINYDWEKQPGITNLLQILSLLTDKTQEQTNNEWVGKTSYGDLKTSVADAVSNLIKDIKDNTSKVNFQDIENKLKSSEEKMTLVANETLYKVQKAVGLR